MALPTVASGSRRLVRVYLFDLQSREVIPERTILLHPPSFEIKIGRGSQTEACLHPQKSNAWFTSRVMSREHAILRADLDSKQIYLEDTGSMHGTFLEGSRLESGMPVAVQNNEKIQFGTEIVRGDQVYKPLQLSLGIDWDDSSLSSPTRTRPGFPIIPKNSFSIDYSENEENDDDDLQIVSETTCPLVLSSATYRQPRTFSVPDSDDTDSSDNEKLVAEDSAPSSPVELNENTPSKKSFSSLLSSIDRKSKKSVEDAASTRPGSTLQSALDVSDDDEDASNKNVIDAMDYISSDEEEDPDFSDNGEGFDSEFDDDEDEEPEMEPEEEPSNYARQKDQQMSETQQNMHNRAPSPSDAAMPKSSWCTSSTLPAIHDIVDQQPSQPLMFNSPFQAVSPPLPGYQPAFGYYTDMNWPNHHGNAGFNGPYDTMIDVPPFHGVPSNMPPTIDTDRCFQSPRISDQSTDQFSLFPPTRNEMSIKSSKVSINDIIEDVQPDLPTACSTRKRKSEEISSSELAEDEFISSRTPAHGTISTNDTIPEDTSVPLPVSSNVPENAVETQTKLDSNFEKGTPNRKSVTFSPNTVIINSESQRPRKRVKVQQENTSSNFLKYFAATVAGATLGAVGTVFGLAALPVDYFA